MTSPAPDRPDFFVSYTGHDRAWAEWIAVVLEQAGYRVLLQAWHSTTGNFVAWMDEAVRTARFILPVLSARYLTSKWCTAEWTTFMHSSKELIPVRIEDFELHGLLAPLVRVSLIGLAEEAAAERLREQLREKAGLPTGEPRTPSQARFPGQITSLAPDPPARPVADLPRERIAPDAVELVLLGAGAAAGDTLVGLPTAFGIEPDRVHDLSESSLGCADLLGELAAVLSRLDDRVSDVVVVVVGTGQQDQDTGISLQLGCGAPGPSTSLALRSLLDAFAGQLALRRVHLLLDVTSARGAPIAANTPGPVPVLNLRTPAAPDGAAAGVAGLLRALAEPPEMLADRLRHWHPLGLHDLAQLSGGTLVAAPEWAWADVDLVPNPLGWPRGRQPAGDEGWCFVLSTSDQRRAGRTIAHSLSLLEKYWAGRLRDAVRAVDPTVELGPTAGRCLASEVLVAPALFARAIEQVCRARIAVFDVTNYEPAVMILLGIRSVIRRGVTLCVHGEHDEVWRRAEPPFHLREVSLVADPTQSTIGERLQAGLRQLGEPGRAYRDLPSFDLIRSVPGEQESRKPRPFDQGTERTMLALVPFDPEYTRTHWSELVSNLTEAAVELRPTAESREAARPKLLRSLDLGSPRVISSQLYEAMRLTDFCLVDVSGVRPNVLFELGVRLAANALHPIVVNDPDFGPPAGSGDSGAPEQREQLCALFDAIQYTPFTDADIGSYEQMVTRHIELRLLATRSGHPRTTTVLGGFPPSGVFDLSWRFADPHDEQVAVPVDEQLVAAADAMLVDPSDGARRLIYPKRHPLADIAEAGGRERLIAAWLYLHHRRAAEARADGPLAERYAELTDRLIDQLGETGDPRDAELADRIEGWRIDATEL